MRYKYDVVWKSKLAKLQGKEEEIMKLHIEDRVSVLQLSKIYECSRKPIERIIRYNGGEIHPTTSPELEGREDEIIKMYLEEELTIQTIRKKIGCTFNTIKGFLRRNGVKLRTVKESRKTEDGRPKGRVQKLFQPEELKELISLYENGESLEVLGKIYNITPRGLSQKLKKLGVKMRTLTESANLPATYERKKVSYLEKYGVENPMQNAAINERSNINRYKFKAVDIHGRRFSHLQGYEAQGITYLIEQMDIDVNDIHSGRKVPKIRYSFDGKRKMYFPDMFVESKNLLVEVKCEYTYKNMLELNKAKREASLNAGYNYLTIIFDNSGKNIIEVF